MLGQQNIACYLLGFLGGAGRFIGMALPGLRSCQVIAVFHVIDVFCLGRIVIVLVQAQMIA